MARAYGVPVVGEGSGTTESVRSRVVRGRPNWWVILAVSLALMALLVATSGNTPHHGGGAHALGGSTSSDSHGAGAGGSRHKSVSSTTTSTTTTVPSRATTKPTQVGDSPTVGATSLTSNSRSLGGSGPPAGNTAAPPTTTTLPPVTTTTAAAGVAQPADRSPTEAYLDPPVDTSDAFSFTGTGAMQVAVVWSGSTYLNLSVSCPSGSQSDGGTGAMQETLPDASGECQATVSEPASESTSLTFTISIGPTGG